MAKEIGFDKYKMSIVAVAGCILIAVVICLLFALGPGQQKTVVFSGHGVPHCPYCGQVVRPFTDFCSNCGRSFRWTNTFVKCPVCDGSGRCPECLGIGYTDRYTEGIVVHGRWSTDSEGVRHYHPPSPPSVTPRKDKTVTFGKCWFCGGKGKCPRCKGEGWIRVGDGPVEYFDRRK